ncbi:hypothetical protein GSF24_21215 [Microbispora triticiradicis]|nr:hypothetical protein [Microbispora triticiradicis]
MHTTVLDHPNAVVRTQAAAKYVQDRLRATERALADIRERKARLIDEVASMDLIEDDLSEEAERYRRRLPAEGLLPVGGEPEGELPLEAQAHAAAEQQREHPHPYAQEGAA